jgi:hypothetical protein
VATGTLKIPVVHDWSKGSAAPSNPNASGRAIAIDCSVGRREVDMAILG